MIKDADGVRPDLQRPLLLGGVFELQPAARLICCGDKRPGTDRSDGDLLADAVIPVRQPVEDLVTVLTVCEPVGEGVGVGPGDVLPVPVDVEIARLCVCLPAEVCVGVSFAGEVNAVS